MKTYVYVLVGFALVLSACGHATVVSRDTGGGLLALQGDRGKAMEDAQVKMASHCGPQGYTVVSEENVVVGQQTNQSERTNYSEDKEDEDTSGSQRTNSVTTTTDVTEYRVGYKCGSVATASAPPAVHAFETQPKDEGAVTPSDDGSTSGGETADKSEF